MFSTRKCGLSKRTMLPVLHGRRCCSHQSLQQIEATQLYSTTCFRLCSRSGRSGSAVAQHRHAASTRRRDRPGRLRPDPCTSWPHHHKRSISGLHPDPSASRPHLLERLQAPSIGETRRQATSDRAAPEPRAARPPASGLFGMDAREN